MTLPTGTRLGRYEVRSRIGVGGVGEVYLAEDSLLDRAVALKVLPPEFASEPQRLARFVREARAASALNHPNILTVFVVGEQSGTHFIVAGLVDGLTLRDWARDARPSLAELVRRRLLSERRSQWGGLFRCRGNAVVLSEKTP